MTKPRQERTKQFLEQTAWGHYGLSLDLIWSAEDLLKLALRQRGAGFTTPTSHVSPHAIGAIVLIATAFDAWLNEVCDLQSNRVDGARKFAAETQSTVAKFTDWLRATSPATQYDTRDLEALTVVRHEIVHYLPRPMPTEGHVASVLADLDARGLLLRNPNVGKDPNVVAHDWEIPQKLASYALAYWAFRTVEAAVGALHAATPPGRSMSVSLAGNFASYRQVCPPEQLCDYDREHQRRRGE